MPTSPSSLRQRFLPWALTGLALAAIILSQKAQDTVAAPYKKQMRDAGAQLAQPMVPSTWALRFLSLGQPQLAADWLWLQMIQYFGQGDPYHNYAALGPMTNQITSLDGKFEYPYEFGMVTLPFMDQIDMALTLGQRSQEQLPQVGLLTYYYATDYHLYKHDYRQASRLYEKASKDTGEPLAPSASTHLAAVTRSKIDSSLSDRYAAYLFWNVVVNNTQDENQKKLYQDWADHAALVYILESGLENFKQSSGHYPATLTELVQSPQWNSTISNPTLQQETTPSLARLLEGKFLEAKKVPTSPVKRQLEYNNQTGKISFDQLAEE